MLLGLKTSGGDSREVSELGVNVQGISQIDNHPTATGMKVQLVFNYADNSLVQHVKC